MAPPVTPSPADGFLGAVRVAWGIFVGSTVGGEQQARAALTAPTLLQGLRFLHDHILTSTPFQVPSSPSSAPFPVSLLMGMGGWAVAE